MNKFLTPLLLAAALSPLAASAQYYEGQRGDYRVESRDGYYYNGRYYDTDRRGGYTYNGRYYNADHRDKRGRFDPRFDPRYTSNRNDRYDNRYNSRYNSQYNRQGYEYDSYGNRVFCRDVVVRDNHNEGAAVAGAIIGGVLGNQIGSGSGRTAATVGGAVVGGLVGNEVGRDRDGNRIERRCERY